MRSSFRLALAASSLAIACAVAEGQLQGMLTAVTFPGPVTGAPVRFTIYLPQGYSDSTDRLPVIFHLHGMDGTHDGPQLSFVPASYEAARAAGLIGPAILVFPDGYGDSLWADSATTNKPAETNVIREILSHVDANYRTSAMRGGRAVQGFSMGGFGCLMYASKYPDLFSACVSYSGSITDWNTLMNVRPDLAAELFAGSLERFQQFSPWFWSQQNAAVLRASVGYRMVVGNITSDLNTNRAYRSHLIGLGITPNYVETGLPHDLPMQLDAEGANSWAFIQANLRGRSSDRCDGDADLSGDVEFADITSVLVNWGRLYPDDAGAGDSDRSGVVNFADITSTLSSFGAACHAGPFR